MSDSHIALGNKLLVYISSCLAGRAYPLSGDVPAEDNQRVRHDVFKCVTCLHSKNASDSEQSYPYLRYVQIPPIYRAVFLWLLLTLLLCGAV